MFACLRFTLVCSLACFLLYLFCGVPVRQITADAQVTINTGMSTGKPLSNEIERDAAIRLPRTRRCSRTSARSTSDLALTLRRAGSSQPTYSP